ncbi:MAG: PepSY domain-containing protein [Carboxylicivirga sp.]|nr:PepSY domain-containing protein [Carboxylicivirga sp.]
MKFWRKYHKWVGIVLTVFLLLFSISGILLNHRQLIRSIDLPRGILTSSYQYGNWNNAALRGSLVLNDSLNLFYGNVGCWLYNQKTEAWSDYNAGLPKGIDNRKISKLIRTDDERLFAGTLFGLYEFKNEAWQYIDLGIKHDRITDLINVEGQLHILTRSELALLNLENNELTIMGLPTPDDYDGKVSLFKTIWVLHSGNILGLSGKILVDIIGLIFIFLSITGLIWFISPSIIKKAKKKLRPAEKQKKAFRFSVKWHNKIGYYAVFFLIFTSLTGIFLRPPLLIAIANAQVKGIPFTMLDTPNAWYDQLRAIRYNKAYDVYFVSTSKGMYALTSNFKEMVKVPVQPPVSVMGINLFEEKEQGSYLIGSFSGLYLWNPFTSTCKDYISGEVHRPISGMARPIGRYMASGYAEFDNKEFYFDYNSGVQKLQDTVDFPKMPEQVIKSSPLSLWNLSLEVHTGRIFQDLMGAFYILIVPLAGLSTIALLISGLWIYLKKYSRKKKAIEIN